MHIKNWAAWCPQLSNNDDWEAWAKSPFPLSAGDTPPKVDHIPAISRRRLGFLTKIVLDLGKRLNISETKPPLILYSKYGEIIQQYKITDNLIENDEISPSAFSSSVFNTSVAQLSIFEGITAPYSALFGDGNSVLLAFFDAYSKLVDGATEVAVIFAEEALPSIYAPELEPQNVPVGFALALELNKSSKTFGKVRISVTQDTDSELSGNYILNLIRAFLLKTDIINSGNVLGFCYD